MLNIDQIHKPTTLQQALAILQQPGTVVLSGGSQLLSQPPRDVQAVVDLSALGLSYIRESSGTIVIGATTTLAMIDESPMLRALANGVIAQATHKSAASIIRNQATIAGTLITEPAGILAVALLALDARVILQSNESRNMEMTVFLGKIEQVKELREKVIVTEIVVPMNNPRASLQTVARTPSDKPIVSIGTSAQVTNGVANNVRIVCGSLGDIAIRASAAEKLLQGQPLTATLIDQAASIVANELSPRGDFRGSAEYRKDMAVVLTRRALRELVV